MSIQPPNGILDITGATLRVSKMEFSNVTGFDTVLNNVARNTVLHVDTTEYTANVAYAVKPPNMFMAQFDLELAAGGTGLPCNFNYYNDSNLGTSFNGYNLSFNDTSIILTYDGGSALHTATLSSSLNNGVYRKVKVLFDRDTTLVSINGENVFRFKDELRPRTYDTGTTGYIRWWHNSPVARKIKNLKVSNGEKWAQEYDSAGLSSNISYTHGLVGVGTSVPEYTLDVAGDIRASGNLIVNGSNTLINTTSLAIEDGVIECGKGNSSAAKDLGFLMVRNDGSSTTNSNVAMFWDESTDALTFGFSDSGPTATTLTPNTTKTLNSYFVGNVGIGTNNPFGKLQVDIADASAATATWDATKVVFGDITNGNSQGLGFGVSTNSHASIISLAPGVAWRGLGYYSAWHKWYINNVEKMVLDASGNVGIGTASPSMQLDCYVGATAYAGIQVRSSSGHAKLIANAAQGGHNGIVKAGDLGIVFSTDSAPSTNEANKGFYIAPWANDTSGIRINENGNIGIGTNSPSYKLQIKSSENQLFLQTGNDVYGTIISSKDEGNGVVPFQIKTMSNGVVNTRVTINNGNGNVGIGTNAPGVKLQVGGNAETTPQYIRIRGERVNAAGDICGIQMYNSVNSGDRGNSSIINARGGNNYGSELQFWTNPDSNAPASEKVRITAYGNLQMVGPQHAPFQKMTPTVATNDYSFFLNVPRPGTSSGGAAHFINGSARTGDGGPSCYTIRNDNGPLSLGHSSYEVKIPGVVDMGSALKRNQIFSNSVSMTSGQWHDIGNFGGYGHGVFVIHVAWGTTSPYWFGGAACVARIHDGTGSYYTWAPEETLQTNQWYHHRAANRLEFRLKSNGSSGNYGVAKLQILGYANITLPGVSVEITRLMAF